jgi:predicted GTPase
MPPDFLSLQNHARNLDALRGHKKRINILLIGHYGYGASALINTLLTLASGNRFLRQTVTRLAEANDDSNHVTRRIQCYRIGTSQCRLLFLLVRRATDGSALMCCA